MKVKEAQAKFGKDPGAALSHIATKVIGDLGRINATREQVRFLQDWVDEVAEMVRPSIVVPK